MTSRFGFIAIAIFNNIISVTCRDSDIISKVYVYNEGDGDDTITNYAYPEDGGAGIYSNNYTLQINSSNIGESIVPEGTNNILIPVGEGSILLVGAAGSNVNIIGTENSGGGTDTNSGGSDNTNNFASDDTTDMGTDNTNTTDTTDDKFTLESEMTYNGHNYYLISTTVESGAESWNDANSWLSTNRNAHLAIINDEAENTELFNFATQKTSEAYFGLTDTEHESTWTWIDGSALDESIYTNGNPWGGTDEPSGGETENYAYFYFNDGKWNDGNVGHRGFVQENGVYFLGEADGVAATDTITYNGHTYQRIDSGMTWAEAKAYCENLGGHLLTVNDEGEQNAIETSLLGSAAKNSYWIGSYENDDGS